MSTIKLKLVRNSGPIKLANANFAYVAYPTSRPTVTTSAVNDLSKYSNTEAMLANVATAYANSVAYVSNQSFVNSSQLSANLSNYTNTSSLVMTTLNDVDDSSLSNNSTLVYSTANNKYVVKQLDLDGGNF